MFNRHIKDFAQFTSAPAAFPRPTDASLVIGGEARLETPDGFVEARALTAGDQVASLDGGFAQIIAVRLAPSDTRAIHVPAGAIGNCSDTLMPAEAHVALTPPPGLRLSEAPYVSVPLAALIGFRGIRPALFTHHAALAFDFADEEMIWAQTGMLTHARPGGDTFYPTFDYGDARGILALIDHSQCGPDQSHAA